jgi:hypothetical protein
MRVALPIAVLVAVVGCGAGAAAPVAEPSTQLKITYWPEGRAEGNPTTWTLRCAPAGGTLPRAAAACQKLLSLKQPFVGPSKDAMCTEQYGGPQVARITGTFRGGKVWTLLQARNGCEIARFKRLSFLVPGYSASGGGSPA